MIRTQIQLEPSQVTRLKRLSAREGISMAEAIRRCIDFQLADDTNTETCWASASELVGAFKDRRGARDLSRKHDDYLEDAFE